MAVQQKTDNAVKLAGVSKVFGDADNRVVALDQIDLDLPYGELVLLVGPSGCGKTTLISLVAGLLDPTQGHVSVLGHDLTEMSGTWKTHAFRCS
jgi:putative ABC transport system ATP-binding protein